MSDTPPCLDGCQLGHGEGCYALRTTRRFCELIAQGRDDYRAYVERQTAAGTDADRPMIAETTPPPSVGESLALLARMRTCPEWVPRSDCGCGVNECRAGKGEAGRVSHAQCFGCLRERGA
jgi:hypothetical protein